MWTQPGRRRATALAGGILILGTVLGSATAIAAPPRASPIEHLNKLAEVGRDWLARLRPEVREALSAGGQNLIQLTTTVDEITEAKAQTRISAKAQAPRGLPSGLGNDPYAAEDLLSRVAGMTQSETSVGWCGTNAVIGYNDSGSFVSTLFLNASPSGSLSFNGWSRSTNRGASYVDMGALIADPVPDGVMFRDVFGDPVIGCTSPSTFYYASLSTDSGFDFEFINSGISVSRSTDGGASFEGAVMAVSKNAEAHFLDKPWMAVSPGPTNSPDDDEIHVSYTDFDVSGFIDPGTAVCPETSRAAIEHVYSTDGGQTWSSPTVLDEVCSDFSFVQGSQVEVGVGDDVYVAWEHYTEPNSDRDIRIARSTDAGASFGDAQVISPVTPIGDAFAVQGNFRAFLDLQGLAVDKSSGPRQGSVYVSWHDGRNRTKVDPFGFCGATPTYCFGDILFSRSTSDGASWSDPVRVNNDDITLGVDQLFPALDVDDSGNVWIAYYDRRRDNRNLLIDTFLARSGNGGQRWSNSRLTSQSFPPITGWQDLIVNPFYMGDYIAVAADATGTYNGVIAAWGDNSLGDANVRQRRN